MTWQEKRAKYEFDKSTKQFAKQKAGYKCEKCGEKGTKDDWLEVYHRLPIIAVVKEFPFIAPLIVKHIANAEVLHHSCHINEVHAEMTESDWAFLAHDLIRRYTEWLDNLIGYEEVVVFSGDD